MSKLKFTLGTVVTMALFSLLFSTGYAIWLPIPGLFLLTSYFLGPVGVIQEFLRYLMHIERPGGDFPLSQTLIALALWLVVGFIYGLIVYSIKSKKMEEVHFHLKDILMTIIAQIVLAVILTYAFTYIFNGYLKYVLHI